MNEGIAQAIRTLLSDIEDTKPLKDHQGPPKALHDLLATYQALAAYQKHLPTLTHGSTGAELKEAIGCLDPGQAMLILARFASRRDDPSSDADAATDEAQTQGHAAAPTGMDLQTQIHVLAVVLAVFALIAIAAAALAILVHLRVVTAGAVIHDMMDTLRDALRALTGLD
jgi:hypothetical protein